MYWDLIRFNWIESGKPMDWVLFMIGLSIGRSPRFSGGVLYLYIYVCVSENSVPLNPMVNDHYPY